MTMYSLAIRKAYALIDHSRQVLLRLSKSKLMLVIFVLYFSGSQQVVAQYSCNNAIEITQIIQNGYDTTFEMDSSTLWYKLTAYDTACSIKIIYCEGSTPANITTFSLMGGSCSNLDSITSSDTSLSIQLTSLSVDSTYYLKISGTAGSGFFKIFNTLFLYSVFLDNQNDCNTVVKTDICTNFFEDAAFACVGDNYEVRVFNGNANDVTSKWDLFLIKDSFDGIHLVEYFDKHNNFSFHYEFTEPGSYWLAIIYYPLGQVSSLQICFIEIVVFGSTSFDLNLIPDKICPSESITIETPSTFFSSVDNQITVYWDGLDPNSSVTYNGLNAPETLTHAYSTCGEKSLTLYVHLKCCGDYEYEKTTEVSLQPSISFSANCPEDEVSFLGTSCLGATTWNWNFGDGHTSNLQNPTHTYELNSQYNVYLVVGNNDPSCKTGTYEHLTFRDSPLKPSISGNNNNCDQVSQYVTYTASNTSPSDSFEWEMINSDNSQTSFGVFQSTTSGVGVDTISITWNPNSTFIDTPERVYLIVTVTNENACSASDTMEIFKCCEGDTIIHGDIPVPPKEFNNTSVLLLGLSTPYEWDGEIVINGVFTIDADLNFLSCEHIKMCAQSRIEILSDKTLTLSSNTSISHKVEYMWDGIYIPDRDAEININNATIKDAINGIVSEQGGSFHLYNASFINNLYGIRVKNFFPPSSTGSWDPIDSYVKKCNFSNDNTSNYRLLYPPFEGVGSFAGMEVARVDGIQIGDYSDEDHLNTFSRLTYGITISTSKIEIYNNDFQYINDYSFVPFPPPSGGVEGILPDECAVFGFNKFPSQSQPYYTFKPHLTVGGTGLRKNTFSQLDYGIVNYNQRTTILYNDFETVRSPILCSGIKEKTEIKYNYITSGDLTVDYAGTGISVQNAMLSSKGDKLYIFNNLIEGLNVGIIAINTRGNNVQIGDNRIIFASPDPPPTVPLKKTGIFVQNCDSIIISKDTIINGFTPTISDTIRNIGIRITSSKGATVINNYAQNLAAGILTNGNLTNTQFVCNQFEDCYHGFFFHKYTSLSNQGIGFNPSYNQQGFNTHNRFVGNYDNHNKLFTPTISYFLNLGPNPKWYYFDNISNDYLLDNSSTNDNYVYSIIYKTINNSAIQVCNQEQGSLAKYISDTLTREEYLGRILRDEDYYSYLQEQYKYYDKNHLYYVFLNDTAALSMGGSDDTFYQQLFDSLKSTDIGHTERFYEYLDDSLIENAIGENQEISTIDEWNDNRRYVNDAFINFWSNGIYNFDSITYNILESIALQIPYSGGDAVYSARVMLGIDPDDNNLVYSAAQKPAKTGGPQIKLFPNPADNEVIIELMGIEKEEIQLYLFDITGKLIFHDIIQRKNDIFLININKIQGGIYFVSITTDGMSSITGKLIVVK